MATIDTYKLKIDVEGADKVEDLKDSLQDVGSAFQKAAAAGVAAFSALSIGAIRLADSIVDLSDATGISAGKIYQLSAATEAAGGKFESGGKMLQAFSRELEGIEKGSETTIEGLKKLGLSRSDLENLSDQQLFNAVVNGLANMDNGFQKTALAMQFFGKEAAGIDFKTLAAELNKTVDPNLDARLRSAADAVRSIEIAYRNLQLAALEAIGPVIEAIGKMNFDIEDARKAIQILGALIAGAFAASVVVQIAKVVDLIKNLALAIRAAGVAQAFLTGLTGVGLVAIAASAAAATLAYQKLGEAMADAADSKQELEGGAIGAPSSAGTPGPQRQVGQTPEERAAIAAKETTNQLRQQITEANKLRQVTLDTIGLESNKANLIRANAEARRTEAEAVAQLEAQIRAEQAKGQDANSEVINQLQEQITLKKQQTQDTIKLNQEEYNRLTALQAQNAEIARTTTQNIRQNELDLLKQQIAAIPVVTEAEQNRLKILTLESEKTKSLIRLEEELKRARLAGNDVLVNDVQRRIDAEKLYYDERIRLEKEQQQAIIEGRQNVAKGVESALEQMARATDPFITAQKSVISVFDNMNSAIDQFVKTGKFKFKEFAASIIQDLIAIQLKAAATKFLSSIFGNIFGLPGLAEGGPAKANKPYIVGENGPELFVPKAAGTVIPNKDMGVTAMAATSRNVDAPITNNYITNNINAVDAKSVAQLFVENRKTLLGSMRMAERELPYMAQESNRWQVYKQL